MRRPWPLLLVLAVACGGGVPGTPASCPQDQGTVSFQKQRLDVQVADDEAERDQGLMGVTSLPQNRGMAFRWGEPTEATFWMKDTLIPLSIAFVDEQGKVIAIHEMTPCTADPCTTYGADAPFTMAVEASANWFADHHISVGDPVSFMGFACS